MAIHYKLTHEMQQKLGGSIVLGLPYAFAANAA
jgi:hypothetical protein